ncbi:hypothetical protein BHE74_00045207, partial [Ensete ventricosum]
CADKTSAGLSDRSKGFAALQVFPQSLSSSRRRRQQQLGSRRQTCDAEAARVPANTRFATDFFKGDENSVQNVPNGGFMYVKSCSNSIELYKYWTMLCRQYPTADRQSILSKGFTEGVVPFSLRFQFLDTANFGGFCQAGGDLRKVCTVQANCCGSAEEKVRGLRSLMQDWNKYRSLSMEEKEGGGFSWSSTSGCKQ